MGYLSCNAESAISICDSSDSWKKKSISSNPPRTFHFADLESATNGFSQSNFLGKGSHGYVYKALFHGGDGGLIAAVKRTTVHHSLQGGINIPSPADNEIETLSRVRSPRLVNLIGFGSDPVDGRKLIVVEYMANGSLYDLLHKNHTKPPGLATRVKIAVQVAKAVHHLHTSNPPVIHRDIKSSNVLFDGKWKARLGDFGLALRGHVEDVKVRCTPPAGTLGYLDPCYLSPGDLTVKSDVFSFGILLLEIISGRNAIDLNYSPPSIVDWAAPLIRSGEYAEIFDPAIEISSDASAEKQLVVLAARCVKSTAEKRPEMKEVLQCLIAVSKRITSLVWNRRRRVKITYPETIERTETVKGSRGSSKVSNGSGENDCCHVERSKWTGSVDNNDIKHIPLDLNMVMKRGLPAVVTMRKSKSTGELQGTGLVHKTKTKTNVGMIRNPNVRELESSKLLVKFS